MEVLSPNLGSETIKLTKDYRDFPQSVEENIGLWTSNGPYTF